MCYLFYRPDGLPPRPYPSRRFRVLSVGTYGKYKGFLKVNFEECYPYFFGWLDPHADGVTLALVEAKTMYYSHYSYIIIIISRANKGVNVNIVCLSKFPGFLK